MKEYLKNMGWKRFVYMVIGVALIGFNVTFMRLANLGTDPYSCMNIGVSNHLPIGYGTYQLLVNIVLFLPVFKLCRRSFGIGAIFNMFGVGYAAELGMWIFAKMKISPLTFEGNYGIRILLFVIGLMLLCFGVALYMECDLGAAPYDMIGEVVEEQTQGRLKFRWVRMFCDFLSMFIGWVSGGTLGIATVFVSFGTGPIASWFRTHITKKMLS